MKIIIDVVLVLILVLCVWVGYRKGLVSGIGGLVAIAVSLYAATLLANTFSHELVPVMYPFADGYMQSLMNNEVSEKLGINEMDLSLDDYLAENPDQTTTFCMESYQAIGIYETEAKQLAAQAQAYAENNEVGIRGAIVQTLCSAVAHTAIVLLGSLLILILITAIANIPNLSFRIPNMDILNDVGGAVVGLFRGIIFCMILVWALMFLGILIGKTTLDSTILARLLAKLNLLSRILGL